MNQFALSCKDLSKSFRSYKKKPGIKGSIQQLFSRDYDKSFACEKFNLDVKRGELVGLLGPNGAGKTTLMKMFTGIIVPSSGDCEVLGYTPHQREIQFRKKIALVMGQKGQLWWDIPAMDSFLLLQKYYEISDDDFHQRLNFLSKELKVDRLLNVHVRKLSLGERMKLELIACLLHNPEIIFLDEPTIGLDLVSQNTIRRFISDYQKEHGTTIFLTSHYMADIDALCSRIVLIFDGKKAFDGSIETFGSILGREKFVTMRFHKGVDQSDPIWKNLDPQWSEESQKVELRIPEDTLRDISIEILQRFPVVDFQTEKLPVERVMHSLLENPNLIRSEG